MGSNNKSFLTGGFFLLLAIYYLLFTAALDAFDRSNVPLKNWGGFSVNRSWVYDALEKVVLAGLADQVLLNTKPLSRVEAARIVGQAVRRLKVDQYGDYNHRGYLEELLYQLVEEFGPELYEMGIRTPLNRKKASGLIRFKPIDHVQFGIHSANRSQRLINDFGRSLRKGATSVSTMDGRIQVGDFLSLYYQPEYSWDGTSYQGGFRSGYGKLTLWNTELLVGRESLWWGPGFRGSMTFSSNGFPLDQARLSSAEPFRLPWLLRYLGPMKLSGFMAQLDKNRDISRAKVGAWRIDLAPLKNLELGFSRVYQFGGKKRGTVNPGKFLRLLFSQGSDNPNSAINVNNVMSFDGTLRIPDVERYILIARDAALYFDFGWDDTLFGLFVPDKPGGIAGTYLTGLFGDPKLDFRFEFATTSDIQFTHSIYTSGFTNRGSVLSHFIGTNGMDIYARLTRWMSPDLLLGLQASRSEIGPTGVGLLSLPREKRSTFGFDLSYRISGHSSVFLGYDFARVNDRDFVAGRSGNDSLFRIEFTRSFEW